MVPCSCSLDTKGLTRPSPATESAIEHRLVDTVFERAGPTGLRGLDCNNLAPKLGLVLTLRPTSLSSPTPDWRNGTAAFSAYRSGVGTKGTAPFARLRLGQQQEIHQVEHAA